ncbi:MAG: translation initiation factor [Dehalococcoidia bacterium]|nr:translation initiation factor [Dehalococcoidia bacterium]
MRDRRGRGGKTATTVTGLPGTEAELDVLLKSLKQLCGAGGSRDGRTIEIQGDHRERLQRKLEEMGYVVRLAGG